ncbi:MAG: CerR family C-terminal domain-containing protein [Candidatus Schekmanbacteria bacterium]|nr:CerR family C-terminal domain-containing protein [Candidatus Schekmanbacteria bacterium]
METVNDISNTRQRILEAAGAVFAEHGFRAATVRKICKRAQVNLAAVNYHFGDKEQLYLTLLKQSFGRIIQKYPPDLGLQPGAAAGQQLYAFILSFLLRILDEEHAGWYGKLMKREMLEPTPALNIFIEEALRPLFNRLSGILKEFLGQNISEQELNLYKSSIVGQCIFYYCSRPVHSRLMPEQKYTRQDIERLAKHITEFSLAGLNKVK